MVRHQACTRTPCTLLPTIALQSVNQFRQAGRLSVKQTNTTVTLHLTTQTRRLNTPHGHPRLKRRAAVIASHRQSSPALTVNHHHHLALFPQRSTRSFVSNSADVAAAAIKQQHQFIIVAVNSNRTDENLEITQHITNRPSR